MSEQAVVLDFQRKVSEKVRLASEGIDRYRVFTPFMFDDGDHLAIVLRKESGRWTLSDEGHTYMHLTYDLDERTSSAALVRRSSTTRCRHSRSTTARASWSCR